MERNNIENLNKKIRENVAQVRERIAVAAQRSGRSAEDVTLVAVSKYAGCTDGIIPAMVQAGCTILGENRPQIFLDKINYFLIRKEVTLSAPVQWHMIGSLQRNKIRKILPFVSLIHSVDSLKLLSDIDRIAEEENVRQQTNSNTVGQTIEAKTNSLFARDITESEDSEDPLLRFPVPPQISVLLEVNISGDGNKHGFTPENLPELFPQLFQFKRVRICGLMGMGALEGTPDEIRREFVNLRKLRDLCVERFNPPDSFKDLSMGMSGDFEIAIEEGATIIRIGSILYPD